MAPITTALSRRIIDEATGTQWPHEGWGGADYFLWAWLSLQPAEYQASAAASPVATVVDYLMCTGLDIGTPGKADAKARDHWEAAAAIFREAIVSGTHPDKVEFDVREFIYDTCHGCPRRCLDCYDE